METASSTLLQYRPAGWLRAAFITGLIAGTLDIAAACTQYVLMAHKPPANVLYFVASGIVGNAAFAGGPAMALMGLALHYGISLFFAVAFYWLYSRLPGLGRHRVLAGLVYGAVVWLIMNALVVPFSQTPKLPFNLFSAAVGVAIIMLCIGLPISLRAARFYAAGNEKRRPV
jgi:uncharacterized membrane protein YagU involved in acid resistance